MNTGTHPISITARWGLALAVVTLLSCETPAHLRDDFGASYKEAIRAQTDQDHVRRSIAGSSLDGRAATLLYDTYIERHRQATNPSQQSAQQPGTALPSTAGGFFSGETSSGVASMPTGEMKP